MKAFARSTLLLIGTIAALGWLLSLGFKTNADRNALLVSAILAAIVQVGAFALIRIVGRQNALVGWGMGAILRGTVLALYGFIFIKLFNLPLTAALVSFAVFLFASMLLESLLLAYES
jgi:hypothetical protein